MPNKTWNMGVDMIPTTDDTYNLGNATKRWKVNGYELADACARDVDTEITFGSASNNVPTTSAVAQYIESYMFQVNVIGTSLTFLLTDESDITADVSGTTLVIDES